MNQRSLKAAARSGFVAVAFVAALAGPVAANTQDRFTIDDVLHNEYSCGVIETVHIVGRGWASFAGDGSWQGTTIHFTYDGLLEDPESGRTIRQVSHQNLTNVAGTIATRGQGTFLRVAGEGVVLHDVGRLVFDGFTGATQSATPKVLPFDDPDVGAAIDAAICSLFD
jgi:hypothetical protein